MADLNSSFTIINQNPLDIALSKNLEGLELIRKKGVMKRKNSQIATVLNYLNNKLPYGNVDLKLINSLPKKEFNRFLARARWAKVWGIVWPEAIVVAYFIAILNIPDKSLLLYFTALPGFVVSLLASILFIVRLSTAMEMTIDGVCIEKIEEKN